MIYPTRESSVSLILLRLKQRGYSYKINATYMQLSWFPVFRSRLRMLPILFVLGSLVFPRRPPGLPASG